MANRHKKASGGKVGFSGAGSNVAQEAVGLKKGGKVVGKMPGDKGKSRFSSGGRAGSDKTPFSSAHRG